MGQASLAQADSGYQVIDPMNKPYLEFFKSTYKNFGWQEEVGEFHPNFKIGSDTWQALELLIEKAYKEGSNLQFCPFLRNFIIYILN